MKQKLHSLLLMVVLLSWSMVIAASDFDDGILKYTITSPSNLEVQCDGFTDAHKNDESVVIPEMVNFNNRTYTILTVKGFGSSKISSVKLPQSLKTIGNSAFYGCSKLKEIEIPNGIETIKSDAFGSCGLSSVVIPTSVKKIESFAFEYNRSLMEVFFLGSEKPKIGDNVFYACHSALTLYVPNKEAYGNAKNTSRLYGDENPQFELTYTGLRNNETSPTWTQAIKVTTTATKKSHCGVYPITVSGGVAQNYQIAEYSNGELTVSKRPLTVKAIDYERSYGEANPAFKIAYDGFANSDNESCISPKPTLSCEATKESNAGTYQILVTGGKADDYAITYQYGKLKVNPLLLGFKETYNTVTYNDMSKSISDLVFQYIPELNMKYDVSDLKIDIWALDNENKYPQHVWTVSSGSYSGSYVNYIADGATDVGKYIITITDIKTPNPNIQLDSKTARAYLTIEEASNNLQWNDDDVIEVEMGEAKELNIAYDADLYSMFNLGFDESVIQVRASNKETNHAKWYVVGLQEGITKLSFNISSRKNDWGFYNFGNSQTITKTIKVITPTGIGQISNNNDVKEVSRYSVNGQRLTAPTKGLNIVKYSDGSVRKEMVK